MGFKVSGLTVFDLDHTLLKVNCSYHFGSFLFKRKFFSPYHLICCLTYYAFHKFLGSSLERVHHKIFNHLFKSRSSHIVNEYVESFLYLQLNQMISEKTFKRLTEAQQQGNYTVILSSTPDFLVGPIAKKLKVDAFKGSLYETNEDGLFVRISQVLNGRSKQEYIQSLQHRLGLGKTPLTVYSDSYLDLPLLEIAEKAVGVNPDACLRRICKKKGWEIL